MKIKQNIDDLIGDPDCPICEGGGWYWDYGPMGIEINKIPCWRCNTFWKRIKRKFKFRTYDKNSTVPFRGKLEDR